MNTTRIRCKSKYRRNSSVCPFAFLCRKVFAHARLMCKSSYADIFFKWKKFSISGFESRQQCFISRSLGLSRRLVYVSWGKKHIHFSSFCHLILLRNCTAIQACKRSRRRRVAPGNMPVHVHSMFCVVTGCFPS